MLDVDEMANAVLAGTQALIAKSLAPIIADNEALRARIAELESREVEPLPNISGMIEDAVVSRADETAKMIDDKISAIPAPAPLVLPDFSKMISDAMPEPIPGKDAVLPDIEKMVSDAVAAMPPPSIPDPIPGKDGLSIADVKQNEDGELIVKMTNGETINAGVVRGAAGIGFDDLAVEYDGERSLMFRFEKGDDIREFAMQIPAIIDRGVWTVGSYEKGDAVSWGGSMWIAQTPTADKPGGVSKDWRLAVKKGRDAKPTVRSE